MIGLTTFISTHPNTEEDSLTNVDERYYGGYAPYRPPNLIGSYNNYEQDGPIYFPGRNPYVPSFPNGRPNQPVHSSAAVAPAPAAEECTG